MSEDTNKDINLQKRNFLVAYGDTFGNVSEACRITGIARSAFYRWKDEDEKFQKALAEVDPKESFKDFVELAAVKKIKEGDTTMIIFAAKSKLKDRGWIERQEITGADGQNIGAFTVEVITNDSNKNTDKQGL